MVRRRFVLRGYVLALPFFRGTQPSYPRYLFKRACRIYIPFAVAIVVSAMLCQLFDLRQHVADAGDWLNEQMNVSASPSLVGRHLLMIGTRGDMALDSIMWSLVYEMRISLIFPLLVLLCRDTRFALLAAAIMLVGCTRFLVALGQTQHPVAVDNVWVTLIWTVRIVPYFLTGILLSKHTDQLRGLMRHIPEPGRIALVAVPVLIFTISHRGYFSIRRDILYDLDAALLIVLALDLPSIGAALNRAVPQWLGRISYSVYLIHTPVLVVVVHALTGRVPLSLIVLAGVLTTLTMAKLMHRLVEVPVIEFGKRFALGKKLREPVTE